MSERELITLAFGNYASLVAAQWANGTSQFDTTHSTLYTQRRAQRVRGGSSSQQRTDAEVSVPRLVLLDAPHATRLKDTCRLNKNRNNRYDNEEEEETQGIRGKEKRPLTLEDDMAQVELSSTSSLSSTPRGENEEVEEQSQQEDEEDKLHSYTTYRDPNGELISKKEMKRMLFNERDTLILWWQYIRSGLDERSVHVLHPLHGMHATAGDVPLLHNFGFGLSQLRSTTNHDIAGVGDSLRQQLEDANLLQGVQCFVDGDSAFGGAACNVMNELWEDVGSKMPAVFFTCFQPLPEEILTCPDMQNNNNNNNNNNLMDIVDVGKRRREEMCLNRLLATSHMTRHDSAVYIPLELSQWDSFFAKPVPGTETETTMQMEIPSWLQNDTATAQMIATLADTSLYGIRDNGTSQTKVNGPAYYLQDWQTAVRPTRSMRVAAALTAMPLRVYDSSNPKNDLWNFMQRNPLLGSWENNKSHLGTFTPLTHSICLDPHSEAGRVLGHALTLRGAGPLKDLTYPRQEALLRYGLPLRTSNYLPLVTDNNYPISSTFPEDFVIPRDIMRSGALKGVDVASHVISTYGSAPMLQGLVTAAQKVLRYRRHIYEETYNIDTDEWKEVVEDVLQIVDDYNHADHDENDEDMDN
ncbi:uncharacterized protein TM35_000142220 [Trypanosoma theileri]|uniref:Uncharacterized protein n=1 Tax=Trypanosoma theileri TaxID=67003 RepID=A0A1X0NWM5_9TRYP|nr:uncharacterized protein TM35_000142220 [Trypanosoma theileri]ORC89011.1 hypothetical protein TM35_000142220 [Trypanosoma theileri]